MALDDLWKKLCRSFPQVPAQWKVAAGSKTEGAYRHSTSILGLSFSPDDTVLAVAGGGCIPGTDGSIRLIDVATKKNVKTLHGHVCGVHDVSFDPPTGLLASASFDYAAHLWNLEKEDVIFLVGEDDKTKGYSRFAPEGSLLAIGEYAYYEGPHSFYVYDLKAQKKVFEMVLPDELGVSSMAFSPDSVFLAVTAEKQNDSEGSRLFLLRLATMEIVQEHPFPDVDFYDLAFVDDGRRLLAGVSGGTFDDFESGLIEIDASSGEIRWTELLGGIGVNIAGRPNSSEVAVGFEGPVLRIYDSKDWQIVREHRLREDDAGRLCRLAYSNRGNLLAYGLSTGEFDILKLNGA
jgi:WD40 repeat protein